MYRKKLLIKRFKILLSIVLLGWTLPSLQGQELLRSDFISLEHIQEQWKILNYGEGSGEYEMLQTDHDEPVLALRTPAANSWIFLIRDFLPEELGDMEELEVAVAILTNQPEKATVVISDGVSYGNRIWRDSVQLGNTALEWEVIRVRIKRSRPENLLSVAAGLDYNSEGTFLAIGGITVCADESGRLDIPNGALQIPARYVLPAERAVVEKTALQLKAMEFPTADFAGTAAVRNSLKSMENFLTVLGEGIVPVNLFRQAKQEAIKWGIACRVVDNMATFNKQTLVAPAAVALQEKMMPRNAADEMLLLIHNYHTESQNIQIRVNGSIAPFSTLYQLEYVEGHPDYPRIFASGEMITLPAGETVGIQLQFNTRDVAAGHYWGQLEMIPFDTAFEVQSIPVRVAVTNLRLPEQMPLDIFHWDYSLAADQAGLRFLIENRVNMFHFAFRGEPGEKDEFAVLERMIDNIRAVAPELKFTIFVEVWFVLQNGGWTPSYNTWLDRLVAVFEASGLGYEDWYLCIYDESLDNVFLDSARAIKAHDPEVRIFSDHLVDNEDQISSFVGVVDAWCPLARQFPPVTDQFATELDIIRESGKPNYVYNCDCEPAQDLALYRGQPWLALLNGLDGCFFWTTNSCSFRYQGKFRNYGLTYVAPDGTLVPSRRFLQWRSGLEDYLIVHAALLDPEWKAEAEAILAEMALVVFSPRTGAMADEFRARLLQHWLIPPAE